MVELWLGMNIFDAFAPY